MDGLRRITADMGTIDLSPIERLLTETESERGALFTHRLYRSLDGLEDVQTFMAHHVFAVWDFMSLLKRLQSHVTCVSAPWRPVGDGLVRRFINEIVLEEESDEVTPGHYASHFEIYLAAMDQAGADRSGISAFLQGLEAGLEVEEALRHPAVPEGARAFVTQTWRTISTSGIHCVAASFAFSRESIIPDMFEPLVASLSEAHPGKLDGLLWYMRRHIALDGDLHNDLAQRLAAVMMKGSAERWSEGTEGVRESLLARIALWDAVVDMNQRRGEAG